MLHKEDMKTIKLVAIIALGLIVVLTAATAFLLYNRPKENGHFVLINCNYVKRAAFTITEDRDKGVSQEEVLKRGDVVIKTVFSTYSQMQKDVNLWTWERVTNMIYNESQYRNMTPKQISEMEFRYCEYATEGKQ